MIRIYAHTENEEQADACYGAFLTGTIPQSGWILTEGAHLYLLDRKPAIPEGEGLAVSEGPVHIISTTLPPAKARAAWRAYLSGRRLPAGCALAAGEGAIGIISSSAYEPDLGHMDMYRLPFDPLEEVVTPREAANLYGADAKRVQGKTGSFLFPKSAIPEIPGFSCAALQKECTGAARRKSRLSP